MKNKFECPFPAMEYLTFVSAWMNAMSKDVCKMQKTLDALEAKGLVADCHVSESGIIWLSVGTSRSGKYDISAKFWYVLTAFKKCGKGTGTVEVEVEYKTSDTMQEEGSPDKIK